MALAYICVSDCPVNAAMCLRLRLNHSSREDCPAVMLFDESLVGSHHKFLFISLFISCCSKNATTRFLKKRGVQRHLSLLVLVTT